MLVVYISPINTDTMSYQVNIYEKSMYQPAIAAEFTSDSIDAIVGFLKEYHTKLDANENLTVKFKIDLGLEDYYSLVTTDSRDNKKFISIFDMLGFYKNISYEAPAPYKFSPTACHGKLSYKEYDEIYTMWSPSGIKEENYVTQPRALLALFHTKSNTDKTDRINANLDNCITLCKSRISRGSSPSMAKLKKKIEG